MDINLISLFPKALLDKLHAHDDLGCYFMHITDARYQHMMSKMMLLLLGNEPFTPNVIHMLYHHHSHMKLTRKEYKMFMEIFDNTLREIGFPQDQIKAVNLRIKSLILQMHSIKHNHCIDTMVSIFDTIQNTKDLNSVRDRLLADVHTLQERFYSSDIGLRKDISCATEESLHDYIDIVPIE
jgi:truncated hemoglobin YjbI